LASVGALGDELGPGLALLIGERHRGACPPFGRRLLDRPIDLGKPPIDIGHDAGLHPDSGIDIGGTPRNRRLAGHRVADVGLGEKAIGADGVECHQDPHQGDERCPESCGPVTPSEARDCGQLAEF
jgi:hypothetical protein